MTAHRVTFIPGDGTGPELAEATQRVLEATGVEFEWDFQDAGVDVYESEGNPLPDRTLDSIRERGVAIKGPTTTPVGSGHRSINVALRKEFDLYACIRPCKAYDGVRTRSKWRFGMPSRHRNGTSLLINRTSWPRPARASASSVATTPLPPTEA